MFQFRRTDIGYICECKNGYQGQNCTTKVTANLFTGVQLYYDHINPVNKAQNVMVVLQSLGTVACTMEIQTHNYVILSLSFSENQLGPFQQSSNIRQVAKELGLRKWHSASDEKGFYLVINATLVSGGRSMLALTITDAKTEQSYYDWYYEHFSLTTEDVVGCFPIIDQPSWYSNQTYEQQNI